MKFVTVSSVFVFSFRQFRYIPTLPLLRNDTFLVMCLPLLRSLTLAVHVCYYRHRFITLLDFCYQVFAQPDSYVQHEENIYWPTSTHLERIDFFASHSDACLCI